MDKRLGYSGPSLSGVPPRRSQRRLGATHLRKRNAGGAVQPGVGHARRRVDAAIHSEVPGAVYSEGAGLEMGPSGGQGVIGGGLT